MGQAKAKAKGKATPKPVKPAPRTNDPERTMANIIEVATHEFSEKGLAGARIDVIAEAMKTSKRMIYYYFGSKEGLYIAVLEQAYSRIRAIEADLHFLAEKVAASPQPKPRLYISCGTEDELLADNRGFRRHLDAVHLEHTYEEGPGQHEWGYWDAQIQRVLDWLPLRK